MKKNMLQLKSHQIEAVEKSADKCGLWYDMRTGKTAISIRLACTRSESCMVICPKSLVSQWNREIEKWNNTDCKFHVLSKETFRRDWKIIDQYHSIVVDECHAQFSNHKNLAHRALMGYKKKYEPKYLWLLTGSPMTASSWCVYAYGQLLDRRWKWIEWERRFFFKIKMGFRMIPQARTDRDEELQNILRRLGNTLSLSEVTYVPEDSDIVEYFPLNKEQKQLIKENFDPLPIVNISRVNQLEQGCLKGDGYRETISFEIDKDKRLLELIAQNDKTIVVCRFLDQIAKIKKSIEKNLNVPVLEIHGGIKESAGDVSLRAEQLEKGVVLIQSATNAGYSLRSFNTMIFASMDYSYVNYIQMKSRVKAMGKETGINYIHMLTEGKDSIDQAVYDCVMKKQDFSIELFNKK